ncbi:YybH family protein [Mycetocola zhujimingii]|uniref:SgcJ/EcaC family oxidoreductase n=1 Tax=Mycetocola zhujimingii TaxID=2079792 RepID=A0A2U1TCS7_9MICO|nr:SgcJ/EcaC family oxidoreductase [Mycetocola zhujimingii]AWB86236.1 DUF4440 domain-containing protein [Mycetocola zhujimingii]PWC06583.1 SgcJ/EcaC family oxidoreductase [Mycetocola zhujimingii]
MSANTNPVTAVLEAYRAAVAARDVSAFAAIYADDVHVFDSWEQWQYLGIEAWRAMATGWFNSLGDTSVRVEFTDLRTFVGDDVAFGHADATFSAISPDGERLHSMTNRFSVGLERQNGAWRIVHEHTSLPIDPESNSAIFAV